MKILIAADMEGITGVTRWDHVDPNHSEYPRFRRIMTAEVNAAVRGAFEGGATEVVVADGHNNGANLMLEELDERARLNTGTGGPFSMVQGIGSDVNGVIFVGYHARAGTPQAILDHTWSGRVFGVWLNDIHVGEVGLNAAVCAHFGAPVLMVTGDQAVCAEATELLGAVESVQVKLATSRFSAENLSTQLTRELIKGAAARAVQRLAAGTAPGLFNPGMPVHVVVEYTHSDMADSVLRLPGTTRLDGRRIAYAAPDMPAAYRAFRAAAALAAS
jgi:D-amino peptidase